MIRNGFVRTSYGEWFALNLFQRFFVDEYQLGEGDDDSIYFNVKGIADVDIPYEDIERDLDQIEIEIASDFEDAEVAQQFLDRMMCDRGQD